LDEIKKPSWTSAFFTCVPAPAGAGLAMMPMYLGFLGLIDNGHNYALLIAPYVAIIALLMVSRIPTYSGKSSGAGVKREHVLPVVGLGVGYLVCLFTYPWETLSISAMAYLVMIPVSIRSYRRKRKEVDTTQG
jgi:CDP-diacylglycerol---serine O-phosphatidyltransferase